MIEIPICDIGMRVDPNWNTIVRIPGPRDELPLPDCVTRLYEDFETTQGRPLEDSLHPHKNCKILGAAFLFDNERIPYYVPLRHYYLSSNDAIQYRTDIPNYPLDKFYDWQVKILDRADYWINHNIKYDLNVLFNETNYIPKAKLICTLNRSKLGPFEERFEYGLTSMMRLLGIDITPYEKLIKGFLGRTLKDYGLIAPDAMGPYAAVDTLAVRFLFEWLEGKRDATTNRVHQLEDDLLPELFRIEQVGMRVDDKKLIVDWKEINQRQVQRVKRIKQITGYEHFQPDKVESLQELFCNRLGWQMDFTTKTLEKLAKHEIKEDEVEYSFARASIIKHKKENPELVNTYLEYQKEEMLFTHFTQPYFEEHMLSGNLIHCWINQLVRSGRTSIQRPGMQQLSPLAKEYIIPYDDTYELVEFDLSQIEFRVIVHYINNQNAIQSFINDPTTDFHDWVAKMCGIPRKPAKNVNFMLGYGGGKGKCIQMLMAMPEIIGGLNTNAQIVQRALDVYNSYHRALPQLKPTQWRASDILRARGYVFTLLGRRRHLPKKAHFAAFNSVCQGSAADIQKDIILRLRKFLSEECMLQNIVHDSFLFSIKKSMIAKMVPLILEEIQQPIEGINFAVPLRAEYGRSDDNWRMCDPKEKLKVLSRRHLPICQPN